MGHNGNHNNPEYVTQFGETLKLRNLGALLIDLWSEQYRNSCPEPLPPVIKLENGEDWRNPRDEWYLLTRQEWMREYQRSLLEFLINAAVLNDPPKGWKPLLNIPGKSPKVLWVAEVMGQEYDDFSEAVLSLATVTEKAVEEAEKN